MSQAVQKRYRVAFKHEDGLDEIRFAILTLDPGDNFRPIVPMNLNWPDGKSGRFTKVSKNGNLFYHEQRLQ